MSSEFQWQPITDLPANWREFSIPELSSLSRVWVEQRDRLKESEAVKVFNDRLRREWSIETGIIERLYTIDRGITQLLIEHGIDAALIPHGATDKPVPEVIRILQDHNDALEGIFTFVANRTSLTGVYIRQLHQALTNHQKYVEAVDQFGNLSNFELAHGEWKKSPNNPTRPNGMVHEYCPPLQVAGEMERLLQWYHGHIDVPPEVEAAWLHHRFTQVHPFQDGNGRVARALATIVFMRAGWFPLVINRDQRSEYVTSLECADNGDLKPLVDLFGQIAKRAFIRALSLSEDVLRSDVSVSLPQLVEGLVDVYTSRPVATEKEYTRVELISQHLANDAVQFLEGVGLDVKQQFNKAKVNLTTRVTGSHEYNEYYYTAQIVSVAKDLNYYANITRPRKWARLHLIDGQKTQIVFSFHYLGKANRGVMACTGFVYFPEAKPESTLTKDADVEPQFGETRRACTEPFTFSYSDEQRLDGLRADFRKWLNNAVGVGLAEWAQRL